MSVFLEAALDHGLGLDANDIPAPALAAAKTFLLDTIGVGIAGAAAPLTPKIRALARGWAGEGPCRLMGGGGGLQPGGAAFVNGFQIHCQEYDCVHEGAVVHPMAVILATLMAEADHASQPISGRDFTAALTVAVDLAATIGVAATGPIRFFRPANAGLFGAVLGLCRLRGLDRERTKDALGHALGFCSGTMQAHVEGTPALPVQIGHAAKSAIAAADLAAAGIPGPHDSLEGPFGYFALFEEQSDPGSAALSFGRDWRMAEISHKPFPTGRAAHGGLVLMQTLRRKIGDPNRIERIVLTAPPLIERLVGRPAKSGMGVNYARLCFAYLGAVMLIRGEVGLSDFTQEALGDEAMLDLASRIGVKSDGRSGPAAFTPQKAVAALSDGLTLEERTDTLYGSPSAPMSEEGQRLKFETCLEFGFGRPAPSEAEALGAAIAGLDRLDDIRLLSRLAAGIGVPS